MNEVGRFGDLKSSVMDVAEWVKFESLIGEEIIIHDFIVAHGDIGQYAIIKFQLLGSDVFKATTTGARVIMAKLELAKEGGYLPLLGKVIKDKAYYDIL